MKPERRVFVLGKHGLVVAAPNAEDAEALLFEVVARLGRSARPVPWVETARLAAIAEGTAYRPVAAETAHSVALDQISLDAAAKGSLYPDHVVFLGRGVHVAAERDTPRALAEAGERPSPPKLILAPGEGAFVL